MPAEFTSRAQSHNRHDPTENNLFLAHSSWIRCSWCLEWGGGRSGAWRAVMNLAALERRLANYWTATVTTGTVPARTRENCWELGTGHLKARHPTKRSELSRNCQRRGR